MIRTAIAELRHLVETDRPTTRWTVRNYQRKVVEDLLSEEDFHVGTIRKWKSGTVLKTTKGWIPYQGAKHHQKAIPPKERDPQDTSRKIGSHLGHIADLLATGKLPRDKTPQEHLDIAHKFLGKHAANLHASLERMQDLVIGEGTAVMGRTKEPESALGKLVRKPKYGTVEGLKDGTGMRVVCQTTQDVLANVAKIKKRYETSASDEEDYINKPKDGYRSYHLIIKDDDDLWKEVQLRTPNQDTWANWCHDVYKPQTQVQEKAVAKAGEEILSYGRTMSDYYYDKDSGKNPTSPPDCPKVVQETFGCLPVE